MLTCPIFFVSFFTSLAILFCKASDVFLAVAISLFSLSMIILLLLLNLMFLNLLLLLLVLIYHILLI